MKAFTQSAERYAKRHWPEQKDWTLNDPRLYESKAYDTILHDAVQDYLVYARKVGRAILAHSLNPAGAPCYRAVVASLHHDGIVFENEDELSAGPVEISQFEGGPPGGGAYGGHAYGDAPSYGGLSIDRNFSNGPGPGCCITPNDYLTMGGMVLGWGEIVLGIEILGLPNVVQGIASPPLDITKLMSGLISISKGFIDFVNAIRGGSGGCTGGGTGHDSCGCGGDK